MELLKNSVQDKKTKYSSYFVEGIIALALAIGSFISTISALGLVYNVRVMFSGTIVKGFILSWNRFADLMGNRNFIILTKYQGEGTSNGLFLSLVAVILICLSYFVVKSKNKYLLLIYVIPVALSSLAFGIGPSDKGIIVLAIGLVLALYNFSLEGIKRSSSMVIPVAILVIAVVLGSASFVKSFASYNPSINQFKDSAKEAVSDLRYGKNGKDKEVALKVTMDAPRQMWLRGFVGEYFNGRSWEANGNYVHYQYLKMGKALDEAGYGAAYQLPKSGSLGLGQLKESKVSIKVENASRKYMFSPYELTGGQLDSQKNFGDSFFVNDGLAGQAEYEYTVSEDVSSRWTEIVGGLFTNLGRADIEEYLVAESHLNKTVYERYTSLSDEEIGQIYKVLGDPGNQEDGHADYGLAIKNIMGYIDEKVLVVDRPAYKDELTFEEFLSLHKANDSEVASLAALMFRFYGIPSRYVEGYQVRPSDIEGAKPGKAIEIKGSNYHAWTEIYVDGIGWVPIEVNPKYKDLIVQADLTKGLENDDFLEQLEQNNSNLENDSSSSDLKQVDESPLQNLLKYLVIGAVVIFAMTLLYLIGKPTLLWIGLMMAFRSKDRRLAVSTIYNQLVIRDLSLPEEAVEIGNMAAYSTKDITEEHRRKMISIWKSRKKFN